MSVEIDQKIQQSRENKTAPLTIANSSLAQEHDETAGDLKNTYNLISFLLFPSILGDYFSHERK
jgi:hypothetical protein